MQVAFHLTGTMLYSALFRREPGGVVGQAQASTDQ